MHRFLHNMAVDELLPSLHGNGLTVSLTTWLLMNWFLHFMAMMNSLLHYMAMDELFPSLYGYE